MIKQIIYLLITILILVIIVIKVLYYFKIIEEFTTIYITDDTKTGIGKYGVNCELCSMCPDNLFETKQCTPNTDTICASTLIQGYGWGDGWVLGDGVNWQGYSYTLVNVDTSNFQSEIVQIAADCYQSTVFLTNDGKVFRCGYNQYKSLGMGTEPGYKYAIPHIFSNLSQIRITKISCGIIHAIFLAESGNVYGLCGESGSSWTNEGQSGTGNTNYDSEPTLISNLNNIIDIACSDSHSLFLKNDGTVWGCGNAHGLGTGWFLSPPSLIPIELSQINNVSKIAAGYDFSIALKNDGTVWGWGRKTERQLGNGFVCETWEGNCAHKEYNIEQMDLTANGTLSIGSVIDISCGRRHTLLLTETGDVYGCGDNSYGQLGTTWWSTGTTNAVGETIYENKYFSYIRFITDNVTKISAKQESSTFLKNNGDVYACGYPQGFAPGLNSYYTLEVKKCNISNVSDLFIGFKRSFYISRK
jgi:alpha-tubulin suppressor-like RCC1 family protein